MADMDAFCARPTTWGDLLTRAARRWPSAEVVFPDERVSFAALDARASELARALIAAGIRRGDHIGVLMPPCIDAIAFMFGIARAGATIVPISDRFKAAELRYVIGHADLVALLTTERTAAYVDFPALLRDAFDDLAGQEAGALALRDAPLLRHVILDAPTDRPELTPLATLEQRAAEVPARAVDERRLGVRVAGPAFLMYTSGTSAQPKGCLLTHEAMTRSAQALAATRYRLEPGDAFWCPLPLFHNGGLSTLAVCLTAGATFVHVGHFDPEVAIEQLHGERCTHWIPTFETIIMPILHHPRLADADLSRLRMGVSAGTPEFLRRFQRMLPSAKVVSNYGSTEGSGSIVMALPEDPLDARSETCGEPLPGIELRIVDPDTGEVLGPDEPGEIQFRGPMRFSAYYKDPELTAASIDDEGWFRTGDRGTLTADGRLTYRGRLKDMLKVGGENVSAAEVEAYLLTHPAVSIAHVVGARDAKYTEVPAAFIELAPGAAATEEEIIDYCVGKIATFKVPRYVRFVTEWPMSGTKVKKYVLRERIEAELDELGIEQAPQVRSRPADSEAAGA